MKILFMNDIGVNLDSANLMSFYMLKDYYEYEVWDLSPIFGTTGTIKNIDEAIFTIALYIFIIVGIFVKLILPILGFSIGIALFKKFKNIWIKCISIGISCISIYYLINYIIFILNNG